MSSTDNTITRLNERRAQNYQLDGDQAAATAALCESLAAEVRARPLDATRPDPARGAQLGELVGEAVAESYAAAVEAWDARRAAEANAR